MSEANVDAVFQQAVTSLSLEQQYVLAQRMNDHFAERASGEAGGSEQEILRRQREAIERTRCIFEGSADASRRHDEIIYGRGKP